MQNLNQKFMYEIGRIKEPEIFIGVARVLKVKLVEEEVDDEGRHVSRDFTDIFADVMSNYAECDRPRKKELLKILRKANEGGEENADRTENS